MANGGQKAASKSATMSHFHAQPAYQLAHLGGAQTISRSSQLYHHYRQLPYAPLYQPSTEGAYQTVGGGPAAAYYEQAAQQHLSLALRSTAARRRSGLASLVQAPQQTVGAHNSQAQIYHEPNSDLNNNNYYLATAIEQQARFAKLNNKPLCRCRVMYLGSSVPHLSKNGLHGIQEPLKQLYPEEQFLGALQSSELQQTNQMRTTIDISHLSSRLGIDSWLSVWSNGLLVENVDEFGREMRRFFSIESLHYCAAVRYFDTLNLQSRETAELNNNEEAAGEQQAEGKAARFLPLDAPIFHYPGMLDASHPPVFAAIMRRTSGVKVLECHAFICRRDAAANALVRCCTHAYADFLSAKRLSAELGAATTPHNAHYYPHHYQAPTMGQQLAAGSMTMPSRRRATRAQAPDENGKQPTYQVVEAIINQQQRRHNSRAAQREQQQEKEQSGKSRHLNSTENSAAATSSSSAPSDHSLQSSATSAADEDNYAIIIRQQTRAQRPASPPTGDLVGSLKRQARAGAKTARATTGSSRSLFDHFQPPPLPPLPSTAAAPTSGGVERLSHSLDQLAIVAANRSRLQQSAEVGALDSGSEAERKQKAQQRAAKQSLVARGRERHSKSMQNLTGGQARRGSGAAPDSERKQRKTSSYSETEVAARELTAGATLGRHSRRHRSDATSASGGGCCEARRHSSSSTDTSASKRPLAPPCCAQAATSAGRAEQRALAPPNYGQQQHKGRSRRSSEKSCGSRRRRRSLAEAELAAEQQMQQVALEQREQLCLLAGGLQPRLPPMPMLPQPAPYYAAHYASPQQHQLAAYYAPFAHHQPIHDPYYAAHLYSVAGAGPPPACPPPAAPLLSQQQHLARAQLAASSQAHTLGRQRGRASSQQPAPTTGHSSSLATKFRCLSPPVNLLWGERGSSSKRHSSSTMAETEAASRRTSELFAASPAAQLGQLTALQARRQSKSSVQLSHQEAAGEPPLERQRASSSPAVDQQQVVSARPGFKRQPQSSDRRHTPKARLSWIKRLSLSMGGGSLRSQSRLSPGAPSANPTGAQDVAAPESTQQQQQQAAASESDAMAASESSGARDSEAAAPAQRDQRPEEAQKGREKAKKKQRRGLFSGALTLGRSSGGSAAGAQP